MNGDAGNSLFGIFVLAFSGLSLGINIILAAVVCKSSKKIRRLRVQAEEQLERSERLQEVADRYSKVREALTKVARRREGIQSNPTVGGP